MLLCLWVIRLFNIPTVIPEFTNSIILFSIVPNATFTLKQFRSQLSTQSHGIINQIFPNKIIELNRLFNDYTNKKFTSQLDFCFEDSQQTDINLSSQSSLFSIYSNIDCSQYSNSSIPTINIPNINKDNSNAPKKRKGNPDEEYKEQNIDHKKIKDGNSKENLHKFCDDANSEYNEIAKLSVQHLNEGKDYRCIEELQKILKDEVACLIEYCCKLRVWISTNTEEKTSGMSTLEVITTELSRVEANSLAFLGTFTKFHVDRSELIKNIYKYPSIHDNFNALVYFDYKHLINIRHHLQDMFNTYVIIHNIFQNDIIPLDD
ncbi:7717_t:CDS:2 [Diversispora eburnea]|uniref:7717_t:CDS:1 n=1 Tax=Diversispora eburnea TaxID=1213867 RepID=A0A9N9BCD6_9GLOM|nr:7717_t:CDS:2 [Diversispora eburnea]